jgi:hypothetical protein
MMEKIFTQDEFNAAIAEAVTKAKTEFETTIDLAGLETSISELKTLNDSLVTEKAQSETKIAELTSKLEMSIDKAEAEALVSESVKAAVARNDKFHERYNTLSKANFTIDEGLKSKIQDMDDDVFEAMVKTLTVNKSVASTTDSVVPINETPPAGIVSASDDKPVAVKIAELLKKKLDSKL